MKKLKGIGVSPGITIGPAYLVPKLHQYVSDHRIPPEETASEIQRLEKALAETEDDLKKIRAQTARNSGTIEAEIFNVHLLLLHDRELKKEIVRQIKEGANAVWSVQTVIYQHLEQLGKVNDAYLNERRYDLEDVGKRLLRSLLGIKGYLSDLKEKVVLIAHNLTPSETASLNRKLVSAFATDVGGPTSHTAIMARALEIPAVVGLKEITGVARPGEIIIVDGQEGVVIVNPDESVLKEYTHRRTDLRKSHRALSPLKDVIACTRDKHRVIIGANIELPVEVSSVLAYGADEIGLFRTEFLYLNREDLPSEEEQFRVYRHVVEKVKPCPVTIRTLDLGGDKFASALNMPEELNPFLGWRAIRFCLSQPDIFKAQLRAILRASAFGPVRIMYPLISDVEEIKAARAITEEAMAELKQENKKFTPSTPVGAMIEVPSAALTSGTISRYVDFFSIGTNDLIQYSMAVDRTNVRTAHLYNPAHPAILKLISEVIAAGRKAGIPVGLCGEMAANPALAFLLIGMGISELSMAPLAIPEVKQMTLLITLAEAMECAQKTAGMDSASEISAMLKNKYAEIIKRKRKK
ncbi:MAG: phosphoenolpyruvate--protein phosphotransferase [Candidatus Ratteibacteria bacterium]